MNNISFKAKIIPTFPKEFVAKTMKNGAENFVGRPWTLAESVTSNKAFTNEIIDCTAVGIKNKDKVKLFHLSTENMDKFDQITNDIQSSFDLKSPDTEVILVGAKPECTHGPDSYKFFNMFVDFFKKMGTSISVFKGGMGVKSLAHSPSSNAWLISSSNMPIMNTGIYIAPQEVLKKMFNVVEISAKDQARWF